MGRLNGIGNLRYLILKFGVKLLVSRFGSYKYKIDIFNIMYVRVLWFWRGLVKGVNIYFFNKEF